MVNPKRARSLCPVCSGVVDNLSSQFCSSTCFHESRYLGYIERWKAGLESGNIGTGRSLALSDNVRKYLLRKLGNACTRCCWAERNPVTGRVPLNVEHIDGNPYNSVETNLTLLCPNCHSLTPTYGGLNRGKGRQQGGP